MKISVEIISTMFLLLLINACSKSPKPIDYGKDSCHFCKMTIVDKIHGAELITEKGKIFKFDATECMLNHMAENSDLQVGGFYTNYYEVPTQLILANEATFLISKKLPSPMGAFLTAFQDRSSAQVVQTEIGGSLYSWEEVRIHISK